ncbi:hypothetical protein HDU86_007115 [Geranomyces michiganensis]|nr:hypothetical protein HDU86_007115 [Geranomyces michiganensis]
MPITLAEPVLTLAFNNIQKLTTIDEDDIQAIWNVFTKCKDNLENGRRLENISWRLWYRSCHGHSPEDDDEEASALDIPNATARHQKHSKAAHVSPESFNRILKNAVEDSSGGSGGRRAVPTELLALKTAAAASISIKQRKQQQQHQQQQKSTVDAVVVPVVEAPTSLLSSPPPPTPLPPHDIAAAAVATAPTPVLAALATVRDTISPVAVQPSRPSQQQQQVTQQRQQQQQQHEAKIHHAVLAAAPPAVAVHTPPPLPPPSTTAQQQHEAKIHHAVLAAAPPAVAVHAPPPLPPPSTTSAAVPRVASALALNQTLQQLLPRNYTAIPRTASAVALNQTRLLAPGARNVSAVTLNHYGAGVGDNGVVDGSGAGPDRRLASGQPLMQYAEPHAPVCMPPQYAQPMYAPQPLHHTQQQQQQPLYAQPQFPQQQPPLQRYLHLGQQHPQQQPQRPTQTLLHPPMAQRAQQQQLQQQQHPVPAKVKFFISESLTPDSTLRHLPPRRQPLATTDTCTATRMTPPPPQPAPARFYTMDSDSCSDSDYSSDFSDSEDDSDSYSDDDDDDDDDVGGTSVATYTPPPLFQKVSLPESVASSGASSATSVDGSAHPAVALTSRRSLLSVAIQQGAALKRAKPSQFRNLSAMGVDEDSLASAGEAGGNHGAGSATNMQDSDSESLCDEMSQSLKENLECERRMMPLNMRYARATSLSSSSSLITANVATLAAHGVYGDDGYW